MVLTSKKIIFIISSLLVLGVAAYYYIGSKNSTEEEASKGNWIYRKSIDIINKNSLPLAEEDVLLSINTKELIELNKLKANCADIRFIDYDGYSQLKYWVEGGCNTEETQIWVRIPLIPSEGKTIYIYYGNTNAEDTQEKWEGKFFIQSFDPCKSNWSLEEEFGERYVKGEKYFGVIGGEKEHTHKIPSEQNAVCSNKAFLTEETGTECINTILGNTLLPSSSLIPYEETYFCSNKDGLLSEESIIMLDTEVIPDDWKHLVQLDNKFTIGKTNNKNTDTINLKHSHKPLCSSEVTTNLSLNKVAIPKSITMSSASNMPPYYKLNYIQNTTQTFFPEAGIGIFNSVPPLGWEYYSTIEGKFPIGAFNTLTDTGGERTHSHTLKVSFEKMNSSFIPTNDNQYLCLDKDSSKSISSSGAENLPPYITVIFAKKKSSLKTTIGKESSVLTFNSPEVKDSLHEKKDDSIIAETPFEKDQGEVLGTFAPGKPSDPLTEGLINPTHLQSSTPSFSAIYTDPDENNASAYQIQVNTNSGFTGTTLWDSGKTSTTIVNNARSSEYTYAGTALTNGNTTLYWRIRFWDLDDDVSEWSDPASFVELFNRFTIGGLRFNGIKID
ncbi:MAG: DUF2341 domain-containing protein [Candidatus Dojkabacteria bacterium]